MDGVLAVALQGMQRDMERLDRVANNLANVRTPGFRREVAVAVPFAARLEAAAGARRVGVADASPSPGDPAGLRILTDTRVGTVRVTGKALDLAIEGPGFFEVRTPSGPAYTRDGSFRLDGRGRVVTAHGHPVMGSSGEITLTGDHPLVDAAGVITEPAPRDGATGSHGVPVGRLRIVVPKDARATARLGEGLLVADRGSPPEVLDSPRVRQGAIESANVTATQEVLDVMQVLRHFESMQRVAQSHDEMLGTAIGKLGDIR